MPAPDLKKQLELEKLLQNPHPGKFDTRVQIRDKHGEVVHMQPYTCHVLDGSKYFERPKQSGNVFYEDGSPAGRVTRTLNGNKAALKFDEGAAHIAMKTPVDEKRELADQLQAAKDELAAIKKEQAELKALSKEEGDINVV